MRSLLADVRYAVRVLVRTPAFALPVVVVLALGIGANTAIFSILNAVLLRPLPFQGQERIVRLFHVPPAATFPGIKRFSLSPANFYDWQRDARSFESMALYRGRGFTLTGSGTPRTILAAGVGPGFFDILGARPAQGRVFRADEDVPASRVVIVSDGFWKTHLGAAPDALGRTLKLNDEAYTIVGVMPPDFTLASWFATAREIWVPLALTDAQRIVRENHNQQAVARLRPGVDIAQAESELALISKRLEQEHPQENAGWGATVVPLREAIVGDIRATLVLLLGAVGLVLLIACANVGNLLFTRALARRKEIAIRAALGAGRARVFQQLVVEALVLAVAGGAAGLLLAHLGLDAGASLLAGQVPRADEISIDARVTVFALAASILTGLLAGVLPAFRAGRTDLTASLKEGGRGDGAIGIRTRRALVVCEVALSVVLLVGAAVMLRSLRALQTVDTGFDGRSVLTMTVSLPVTRYETPAQRTAFFDGALERLRVLPGVTAAGAIDDLPLSGGSVQPIVVEGRPELLPREQPTVQVRAMTPGYLKAMGIPILRGRDVADGDIDVMLVSLNAARLLWGDADPIGQRVTLPLQSRTRTRTIVGIVGDVKQDSLTEAALPSVYNYTRERDQAGLSLVIRASVPPSSIASSAVGVIRTLDPEQPIAVVRTMEEWMDRALQPRSTPTLLLTIFGAVALVLSAIGIYGVLAFGVAQRVREFGIRQALGADRARILSLVLTQGLRTAALGVAIGLAAAFALTRYLQTLLFGIGTHDTIVFIVVPIVLLIVAAFACYIPARRATAVDPMVALRDS